MPTPLLLALPGDGIGPEVTEQALRILSYLAEAGRFDVHVETKEIGGASIKRTGYPLTEEVREAAGRCDAILLGSVGGPKWDFHPDPTQRAGHALLTIRKELDLFANIRPIQVFDGLESASTLKPDVIAGVDMIIVRELTGGIYFGQPRGVARDSAGERHGWNTLAYSEREVRRVARVAFALSLTRRRALCSVDKANVLETMGMWRDVVVDLHAVEFSEVSLDHMFVDNAAMQMVRAPRQFDVVLTDNMFGDILSDCAAMVSGSLGMLPSASFGDRRNRLGGRQGLYEPVHGSANDIAGLDLANPLAAILSLEMLLRHSLLQEAAADRLMQAIKDVLREGYRTRDLAGSGTPVGTSAMGDAVLSALSRIDRKAA